MLFDNDRPQVLKLLSVLLGFCPNLRLHAFGKPLLVNIFSMYLSLHISRLCTSQAHVSPSSRLLLSVTHEQAGEYYSTISAWFEENAQQSHPFNHTAVRACAMGTEHFAVLKTGMRLVSLFDVYFSL